MRVGINKYSRSERIGVLIVAVIAILVIMGGMCRSKYLEEDASADVEVTQLSAESCEVATSSDLCEEKTEDSDEKKNFGKSERYKEGKKTLKNGKKIDKENEDNGDVNARRQWLDEKVK